MYYNGKGVTQDYEAAIKWYKLAAEQGYAQAQELLGEMYRNGHGVTQDYETAFKWYKLAAEQGNSIAQNNLGAMFALGHGVTQDFRAALKWYKLAAEQRFVKAQLSLGTMYFEGKGVTQDYKTAVNWFLLAAEQGDIESQYNLGLMFARGLGVIQNYTQAYMWWDIAESQGNAEAKRGRRIIEKQMTSEEVRKALVLAQEWITNYNNATSKIIKPPSEQKIAADQYKSGRAYALGQDVTTDLTRAYMWWAIAASNGNEDARRGRGIIEEQMTPAQIKKAQELTRECVTKNYKGC